MELVSVVLMPVSVVVAPVSVAFVLFSFLQPVPKTARAAIVTRTRIDFFIFDFPS